jgi:hypothetical protein
MRLKQHRLIRPFALTAAAMLAMAVALVWGTEVGLAATATGYYEDGSGNVCVGFGSPFPPSSCEWGSHVTGESNVALGDAMMPNLTSGFDNVAFDSGALVSDTSGSWNIATGFDALASNTEGSSNIASGPFALRFNTTGCCNIALGQKALVFNTTGRFNTAVGEEALADNTTGSINVATGAGALLANTTGGSSVATGYAALIRSTGSLNVALGDFAGFNVTSGSNNIDISNEGVAADARTTRIGTEGAQTKAFMAGVYPTLISGCTVQVNIEGQLGCNPAAGGATGATGAAGATGATGPTGAKGEIGGTGATGPAGTAGATSATVATSQGTTSTSYTDLVGSKGPEVTVPIPSSGNALVTVTAQATIKSEGSAAMGFAVSGMSAVIASDDKAFIVPFFGNSNNSPNLKAQASATYLVTGLVMGSNTFTAKYKVTVARKEGTWQNRSIIVIPLP